MFCFVDVKPSSLAQSAGVWASNFMWLGLMSCHEGYFWKVLLTHGAFDGARFSLEAICAVCGDWRFSSLVSARLTLVLSADGKLHALITKQFAFVGFILWGAFFGTFALMLPKPLVVSKNLATFPTRQRWFTGLHHLRVGRCICDCWDLTENHLKELYSPDSFSLCHLRNSPVNAGLKLCIYLSGVSS